MSQKTSPSFPSSITTSLALSSLHERQAVLEKENQWLLKQIKRKRTELSNYIDQMRSVATDIYHKCTPCFKKIASIDREIHALFDEILSKRKLGKQSRKNIQQVYRNLQFSGVISPKLDQSEDIGLDKLFESEEQNYDFFNSPQDSSEQHQEAPQQQEVDSVNQSNEATRKIRQIFLRLAEIFHPDKVTDDEKQMRYTEIMKEINIAYQEGDLARLLEIEQQHQRLESIKSNNSDDLTRRCINLEQENEFLKTQYENLKRELRMVKNTPEGVIVSDYRKAVRQGIDPIAQMVEEAESEIAIISSIRDFVRDFVQQKMTIKDFIQGPEILRQMNREMIEEMIDEMFVNFVI